MKRIMVLSSTIFWLIASSQSQTIKLIKLSDLENRIKAGKDTIYVINFWATWCKPCIDELPYFEKLSAERHIQPLKVLLVSVDTKSKLASAVKPFIKRNSIKNEVLYITESSFTSKIDKNWMGDLPATLFWNAKTNKKKFMANAFTYPELVNHFKEMEN